MSQGIVCETTDAAQMRNESSGTGGNVLTQDAWFCLSPASMTFLLQAAAGHVFSDTLTGLSRDMRLHTQWLRHLS